MSSSLTKGLRRSTTRSAAKRASAKTAKRAVKAKPASKPKAKRATAAKGPARKISPKARSTKKTASSKYTSKGKKAASKPVKKAAPKKTAPKKAAVSRVKKTQKVAAVRAVRPLPRPVQPTAPPPRQPTQDESAALVAFERAHKEFVRGRFAESRNQFRILLDKYSQVSEVAARARTYLAISESRLRTESMLPKDADSLYDRGVIELNRGEYVAAQEMFERALKREPEAAHIHYGLAATRARLGSIDLALESLQRAVDLQPNLRLRAQHDHDLNPLRNDPDFDRLVFSNPS
ncbi:MAG TPA: tetratricopeptide repeat protein [Pyrinomonadaceae bacterium]|nr:tetratricopeptide repeat protein [Pyrinomonadaceae bacterium]